MYKSGDKIGPYTLIRKIGRGGFGEVWLAERHSAIASRQAAVKLAIEANPDLDAIKQEAELWIKAGTHANVLPIIEADIYDGQIVIVSEFAPDGSVKDWLDRHTGTTPSIEVAVKIVMATLDGLEHLHVRGIVHRDLKPENILLMGENPRIADFGIARVMKANGHSYSVIGTPQYMAPEAFRGERSIQTDIWSMGIILQQCLTGELPFPQSDIYALMNAIITRAPEPVSAFVPTPLAMVIACALQKDPILRYKSAVEMRVALQIALEEVTQEAILISTSSALPKLPKWRVDLKKLMTWFF